MGKTEAQLADMCGATNTEGNIQKLLKFISYEAFQVRATFDNFDSGQQDADLLNGAFDILLNMAAAFRTARTGDSPSDSMFAIDTEILQESQEAEDDLCPECGWDGNTPVLTNLCDDCTINVGFLPQEEGTS